MTPQRIKGAAKKYADAKHEYTAAIQKQAYIAGATAEYHRTIDEVDKALHAERNKMQAKFSEVDKQYAGLLKEQREKAQGLVDALEELITLKKMKDELGKTTNYLTRQPAAWKRAIEELAKWKGEVEPKEPAAPLPALGICVECKSRPATTDYNGHGHFVCDVCDKILNNEFDEEYR